MSDTLSSFIAYWSTNQASEQTPQTVKSWPFTNTDALWDDLSQRQWLRQGHSGGWGLAPQAIQYAHQNTTRISPLQAQNLIEQTLQRVGQWNTYAEKRGLAHIAWMGVWGSVAAPNATDHGDVDLCVVWRRPKAVPIATEDPPPVVCNEHNRWDLEDRVEEWIAQDPLVNISGVDQWEEFGPQPHFCARTIFCDSLWSNNNDEGVSPQEAHTARLYTTKGLPLKQNVVK